MRRSPAAVVETCPDGTLEAVPQAQTEHQPDDPTDDLDLSPLDRALERLYRTRALVGVMPPAPATRRGRAGATLVRVVRRSLFWLLPQVDAFHGAMIEFAEIQATLMEQIRGHLIDIDQELETMRQQVAGVHNRPQTTDSAEQPGGELWLQLVRCQARVDAVRQALHRDDRQPAGDPA